MQAEASYIVYKKGNKSNALFTKQFLVRLISCHLIFILILIKTQKQAVMTSLTLLIPFHLQLYLFFLALADVNIETISRVVVDLLHLILPSLVLEKL